MYALYVHKPRRFLFWAKTRREFVGWFDAYNDACGYAFNVLGHDTSATFTIVRREP